MNNKRGKSLSLRSVTHFFLKHFTLAILTTIVLSGCGGGGGGGSGGGSSNSGSGSGGTSSGTTSAVAVTSANASSISADVIGDVTGTIGIGSAAGGAVTGVVTGVDVQTQVKRFNLSVFSQRQIQQLVRLQDQPTIQMAIGVQTTTTYTYNCTSGNITTTWNDADQNKMYSPGDSTTVTYNNCYDAAFGGTFNGGMTTTFVTMSDPTFSGASWEMSSGFSINNLQFTSDGETLTVNGDYNFSMKVNGNILTSESIGNSLTLSDSTGATTISNFSFSLTQDTSTSAYTFTASGAASGIAAGGSVTYTTLVSFQGTDILANWPTSGSTKIVGANNSSATVTAMGGNNVKIEVDSNGDGGVDNTINTTWTDLELLM